MLVPHRFMNLEMSLVHVAAKVIERLLEGECTLSRLSESCRSSIPEVAMEDIISAIGFLFLLGKVIYEVETDLVTLVHE